MSRPTTQAMPAIFHADADERWLPIRDTPRQMAAKEAERQAIADAIAEYEAAGGVIHYLPADPAEPVQHVNHARHRR